MLHQILLRHCLLNQSDALSKIQDTDYAKETSDVATQKIIQSAGIATLAQANNLNQGALALLR